MFYMDLISSLFSVRHESARAQFMGAKIYPKSPNDPSSILTEKLKSEDHELLGGSDIVFLMNEMIDQKRKLVLNCCQMFIRDSALFCPYRKCCMPRHDKVKLKLF
jgi:hypothetical protein